MGFFNTQNMFWHYREKFSDWVLAELIGKKDNAMAQNTTFNPISLVQKWNTPILIIQGGRF
jgi:hypothetical protein